MGASGCAQRARELEASSSGEESDGNVVQGVHVEEQVGITCYCPSRHVMVANLSREGRVWNWYRPPQQCERCSAEITMLHGGYHCDDCGIDYCLACSRVLTVSPTELSRGMTGLDLLRVVMKMGADEHQPGLVLDVGAGDMFFCGPDAFGTHHVLLVCGPLTQVDEDIKQMMQLEPHMEAYSCETIESTQSKTGNHTWWSRANSYFSRDLRTGDCSLIGDYSCEDSDSPLELLKRPVPVRILMHPLRKDSNCLELDTKVFEAVTDAAAERSQQYSWHTVVTSLKAGRHELEAEDYPTVEDRLALMDKIRTSWLKPPICSSVPIKVWQQYFEQISRERHDGDDHAAQLILKYIPVFCHKTFPSALAHICSKRGWVLRGSFDFAPWDSPSTQ